MTPQSALAIAAGLLGQAGENANCPPRSSALALTTHSADQGEKAEGASGNLTNWRKHLQILGLNRLITPSRWKAQRNWRFFAGKCRECRFPSRQRRLLPQR
jgi:hypothetical protein